MFRAENTARSDVPGIIRSSTSGGGQAMMVSPMNNSSKLANILTTAVCSKMFKAGASLRRVVTQWISFYRTIFLFFFIELKSRTLFEYPIYCRFINEKLDILNLSEMFIRNIITWSLVSSVCVCVRWDDAGMSRAAILKYEVSTRKRESGPTRKR